MVNATVSKSGSVIFIDGRMAKPTQKVKRIAGVNNAMIRALALKLEKCVQTKIPVKNRFAHGIYAREIKIPAGTFVIGKEHREENLNVMLSGKMKLFVDGVAREVSAPFVVVASASSIKMAVTLEETRWLTICANPTNERNVKKLENILTVPLRKQLA